MKSKIISIGNSKGLRLPKPALEESGLEGDVDIVVKKGEIKIVPAQKPLKANQFAAASEATFAKDWLRPEEEEAWKSYQQAK